MKDNSYKGFFENFANETRLKIIEVLEEGPKSVSEICEAVEEEQSKISHNLKKLKQCRLISFKRKGKKHVYSLNKKTTVPLLKIVKDHTKNHCKFCSKK